jgi:hypothetical protein
MCNSLPEIDFPEAAIEVVKSRVIKKKIEMYINDRYGSDMCLILFTGLGSIDVKFHKKRGFSVDVLVFNTMFERIGHVTFKKDVLKEPFLQFILCHFPSMIYDYINNGMRKKWTIVQPFAFKLANLPNISKRIKIGTTHNSKSFNYIA